MCKSVACASDNINNINLTNKYEILSEHLDLKMDQEKIPVIVGGRTMKVISTHENLLGGRAWKSMNKNRLQQVKRNNGGVKFSVNKNKQGKKTIKSYY
jgi:hypothetical protein